MTVFSLSTLPPPLTPTLLLSRVSISVFRQFAKKFYLAQWFRDTASEAEKAIKSQTEMDTDLKGRFYSGDTETTEEIMQRAEARKKFLLKAMKATHSTSPG